jgi:hypothetical protein
MEKYKNFVVYGPGRTGSHWVENLLVGLFPTVHYRKDQFCVFSDHWIYHTNNFMDLIDIPREMRDSITLIVCDRANTFDRLISYIVAIKTTEFFYYTAKIIEPFRVDPESFKDLSRSHQLYLDEFNRTILPIYNNVIRIDYDVVASAAVPAQYIADQLGVAHQVRSDYHHGSIKNIRNYKDLILNWEELHQIHQEWPVDQ